MRKLKKHISKQIGFSLIELMIAVGIIGLLAVIAIPSYQKAKFKARQSEARTQLSVLYTIERTFVIQYGYGAVNFYQLGFQPQGQYYYNVGWSSVASRNNPLNKYDRTTINSSLSRPYHGPLVRGPSGNDYHLSRNIYDYCKVPFDSRPRDNANCFLINGRLSGGVNPSMTIPDSVLGSDLGQAQNRDINVINNGYRDVEFVIGASTKLKSQDIWVITDRKQIINTRSGLQ